MAKGVVSQFWFLIIFSAIVGYYIMGARAGKKVHLRKLPGVDAVEEAIGRAAELGKPVLYTPGLDTLMYPEMIAGIAFLPYVATLTARYNVRLICAQRDQVVYSVAEEAIRQAYAAQGKLAQFNRSDVRVFPDRYGYVSGMIGIIENDKPAANIMVGLFRAEALIFAETGNRAGCFQISASMEQIPFFVAVCDYAMIGEELYAASAYVSDDESQRATIAGQDIGKVIVIALVVVGAVLSTAGSNVLSQMMKM